MAISPCWRLADDPPYEGCAARRKQARIRSGRTRSASFLPAIEACRADSAVSAVAHVCAGLVSAA